MFKKLNASFCTLMRADEETTLSTQKNVRHLITIKYTSTEYKYIFWTGFEYST